jgi:aryl-alcohol dehydrogenase-like predicted oxidoreductase
MLPVRQKPLAGTSGLVDNKASRLILDTAYDLGYRTFDTARVYAKGDSENCIGRWVKDRRIRDQVTVITKCGHPSHRNRLAPSDLEHDIDASLKALRVDCLDMVLLHRADAAMPVGGLVTFFDARIRQGKLKAYGVSNWRLARLLEAKDFAKANTLQGPVVSSLHFSLGSWDNPPWPGCVSLSAPDAQAERDWYASTQFPIFSWSSLCGGFYNAGGHQKLKVDTNRLIYETKENLERRRRASAMAKERALTVAQVVLAYVYSQPLHVSPITYSRDAAHYKQNLEAAQIELSDAECRWLNLEIDQLP